MLRLEWRLDSLKALTPRAYVYRPPYTDVTRSYSVRLIGETTLCTNFIAYVKVHNLYLQQLLKLSVTYQMGPPTSWKTTQKLQRHGCLHSWYEIRDMNFAFKMRITFANINALLSVLFRTKFETSYHQLLFSWITVWPNPSTFQVICSFNDALQGCFSRPETAIIS